MKSLPLPILVCAAALPILAASASPASAGASAGAAAAAAPAARAAKGRQIYAACAACHAATGENKTGPGLAGIVGRRAGTAPGFRYSRAMRRAKIVWGEATLDAYLADPQGNVPGNTMPFPGIPNEEQRKDLIAYLQTLK